MSEARTGRERAVVVRVRVAPLVGGGWYGYAPEMSGCCVVGTTLAHTRELLRLALSLRLRIEIVTVDVAISEPLNGLRPERR